MASSEEGVGVSAPGTAGGNGEAAQSLSPQESLSLSLPHPGPSMLAAATR